jgi:hypothetical protein
MSLSFLCRDIKREAFAAALQQQLSLLDPSEAAVQARKAGVGSAMPQPKTAHAQLQQRSASAPCNSAIDGDLEELRAKRLVALQRQQREATSAVQHGRLLDLSARDAQASFYKT